MMKRATILVAFALLAMVPNASAGAEAWADDEVVAPGETVHLVFETDAPHDVDVAVDRRVVCTVTGPGDFEESPCEHSEGAVTAQVLDSGRTQYVFAYRTPDAAGAYDVLFEVRDTLSVPGNGYAATTSFVVDPSEPRGADPSGDTPAGPGAGDPDAPDTLPDDGSGSAPGDDGPGSASDEGSSRGRQGLVVGGSVGTAALVAALAARRSPL